MCIAACTWVCGAIEHTTWKSKTDQCCVCDRVYWLIPSTEVCAACKTNEMDTTINDECQMSISIAAYAYTCGAVQHVRQRKDQSNDKGLSKFHWLAPAVTNCDHCKTLQADSNSSIGVSIGDATVAEQSKHMSLAKEELETQKDQDTYANDHISLSITIKDPTKTSHSRLSSDNILASGAATSGTSPSTRTHSSIIATSSRADDDNTTDTKAKPGLNLLEPPRRPQPTPSNTPAYSNLNDDYVHSTTSPGSQKRKRKLAHAQGMTAGGHELGKKKRDGKDKTRRKSTEEAEHRETLGPGSQ